MATAASTSVLVAMSSKRKQRKQNPTRVAFGAMVWVPFIVIIAVFLAMSQRFWTYTVDDAFISFRYAKNLVHGWGLVFNEGERVEGYTNFLWVILSTIPEILGIPPEAFAKIVGLLCGVGVLVSVSHSANRLSPYVRWLPALFAATSPPFVLWATSGLETPLFSFLVTIGILRSAWAVERGETDVYAALALGLAALTRPEGALVAATVSSVCLIFVMKRVVTWPSWLKWNLAFLGVFVPYFLWRYAYYGYLFPNTFYAKVHPGSSEALRGCRYLHNWLLVSGYWLLVLLVGLLWVKRSRFLAIIGTTLGVYGLYIVVVGGDGLPMYRFFAPLAGLSYLLLVGLGADGVLNRWHGRRFVTSAGAIFLALALAWTVRPFAYGADYDSVRKNVREVWTWKVIGGWFRQNAPAGASVAVIPAGAVPYFSELRALDMLGLNDVTIAHRQIASVGEGQAGHEKYDVAHFLQWKPTYVLIGVYRLNRQLRPPEEMIWPIYPAETELLRSPEFQRTYRLMSAAVAGGYFYYYVRREG